MLRVKDINKKLMKSWEEGKTPSEIFGPKNGDMKMVGGFTGKSGKYFKFVDGEWKFSYELKDYSETKKNPLTKRPVDIISCCATEWGNVR